MKLKKINPFTNGTRHQLNIKKNILLKYNHIIKNLKKGYTLANGRSKLTGHITCRHKGSGVKKNYYTLTNDYYNGLVISTSYNALKSSFLNLNFDLKKKKFFYSTAIKNVLPGNLITFKKQNIYNLNQGTSLKLKLLPVGTIISLIRLNNKITFIKSAGTYGQIIEKKINVSKIRLPSGKIMTISNNNVVTIGIVSNSKHRLISYGKAGRIRHRNKRPTVRGIAMNPVDHPHGGRSNGGCISMTPWGIPTKGKKTVFFKNYE